MKPTRVLALAAALARLPCFTTSNKQWLQSLQPRCQCYLDVSISVRFLMRKYLMAQLNETAGVGAVCSRETATKFPLAATRHVAHQARAAEGQSGRSLEIKHKENHSNADASSRMPSGRCDVAAGVPWAKGRRRFALTSPSGSAVTKALCTAHRRTRFCFRRRPQCRHARLAPLHPQLDANAFAFTTHSKCSGVLGLSPRRFTFAEYAT